MPSTIRFAQLLVQDATSDIISRANLRAAREWVDRLGYFETCDFAATYNWSELPKNMRINKQRHCFLCVKFNRGALSPADAEQKATEWFQQALGFNRAYGPNFFVTLMLSGKRIWEHAVIPYEYRKVWTDYNWSGVACLLPGTETRVFAGRKTLFRKPLVLSVSRDVENYDTSHLVPWPLRTPDSITCHLLEEHSTGDVFDMDKIDDFDSVMAAIDEWRAAWRSHHGESPFSFRLATLWLDTVNAIISYATIGEISRAQADVMFSATRLLVGWEVLVDLDLSRVYASWRSQRLHNSSGALSLKTIQSKWSILTSSIREKFVNQSK